MSGSSRSRPHRDQSTICQQPITFDGVSLEEECVEVRSVQKNRASAFVNIPAFARRLHDITPGDDEVVIKATPDAILILPVDGGDGNG